MVCWLQVSTDLTEDLNLIFQSVQWRVRSQSPATPASERSNVLDHHRDCNHMYKPTLTPIYSLTKNSKSEKKLQQDRRTYLWLLAIFFLNQWLMDKVVISPGMELVHGPRYTSAPQDWPISRLCRVRYLCWVPIWPHSLGWSISYLVTG